MKYGMADLEMAMDRRTAVAPERARAGERSGVVRYILAISLVLVVILFAVAYVIAV